MTDRLYLRDAYLREFQARVVATHGKRGSHGVVLELDRTVFYPTSGGQLHDTGTLGGFRVHEVMEDEDGRIAHHVTEAHAAGPLVGETVSGEIDWARRFDHMQQHTGQHVLSQAALRELSASTVAVHLGADRCTLDLDVADFGPEEAARVEDAANAAVTANLAVTLHFVDEAEIERWGLRRPPKKSGLIRVVDIEGFDRSACGGTHVRATGEINAIALTAWARYKGGTRVEFLCGGRALQDHRRKSRLLAEVSRSLSVGESELVDAVTRLGAREREASRRAEEAQTRLYALEAETRRRGLERPAVIAEHLREREVEEVRALAQALVRDGGVVALGAAEGRVVFARSADLDLDVAALLRRTLGEAGRGGGRADLAQGSVGVGADLQAVLTTARRAAEEALRPA